MSLREYVTILFSDDLSMQEEDVQKAAVAKLWLYVSDHKDLWGERAERKVREDFAPFFIGHIEELKVYADAHGVRFKPEVFRGSVSEENKTAIKQLGFDMI